MELPIINVTPAGNLTSLAGSNKALITITDFGNINSLANPLNLNFIKARGNSSTPTAAANADQTMRLSQHVYNGNTYPRSSIISAAAPLAANATYTGSTAAWTPGSLTITTGNPDGTITSASLLNVQNSYSFNERGGLLITPGSPGNGTIGSGGGISLSGWGVNADGSGQGPRLNFNRGRGNRDTQASVVNGDIVGISLYAAYTGNGTQATNYGRIQFVVDTTYSAITTTSVPMNCQIVTAGNATTYTYTFDTLGGLTMTGNVSSGNASLGNLAQANFFSGDGSLLTAITGANVINTTTNGITAAGTIQANATAITSDVNFVSTTPAGSGVILPNVRVGQIVNIINHGGNYLNVYPASGQTIDALAANVALSVPRGATLRMTSKSGTGWEGIDVNTYDDENYCLIMPNAPTSPPTPNQASGLLYSESIAGRSSPEWKDESGYDYGLQAAQMDKMIGWLKPTPGVATPVTLSMSAPTILTTSTAVTEAITNRFTRIPRTSSVSTGTAGLASGYYTAASGTAISLGTGTVGGFLISILFGSGDTLAQAICFAGLTNVTTTPGVTTSPAALTNCIGIGAATGDTNMSLYYGGSAAQTPIALGADFPKSTANTDMYRLTLYAPSNISDTIGYKVTNMTSGAASVSGTITAGTPGLQLPLNTAALYWRCYRTNNTTATATTTVLAQVYLETNY